MAGRPSPFCSPTAISRRLFMTELSTQKTFGIWPEMMAGRRETQWILSRLLSRQRKRRRLALANFAPSTEMLVFCDHLWVGDSRSGN